MLLHCHANHSVHGSVKLHSRDAPLVHVHVHAGVCFVHLIMNDWSESFTKRMEELDLGPFLQDNVLAILGASVLVFVVYRIWKWPRNLPPGPRNWPIQRAITYPEMMHLDFMRLGDKYGDVFSFYMGNK